MSRKFKLQEDAYGCEFDQYNGKYITFKDYGGV